MKTAPHNSLNATAIHSTNEQDEHFMRLAIAQADAAKAIGEVPVGAIVVLNDKVIGAGHNLTITKSDPSLHAEMVAIRHASEHISNYRLVNASIYVTLEPCAMCAGLLVHSRIKRLIFGASDPKAGAAGSVMNIVHHDQLNHKIECESGVLGHQCSEQLSAFFQERRALKKAMKALKSEHSD